ncbi:MAG: TCR/Tet family MFS transporter [Saprospiraceae bacterium]|nr:TCR/Tet family MFS transporter [Candidatus Opimibacter skivensis]MBL0008261.1 TCR/Tet family MFS transporter [Candidatus Opimibacter skivensis]MBP9744661.1 TCR/Tet family MFS transporter [Saprospiraceae bacterium]
MSTRKAAIGFIFVTLLIDVIGWGIIIPVMPTLISTMEHVEVGDASSLNGWMLFAFSLTQFLFAPLVGNLSDKYGRRPILLVSLFGFGLDYILMSWAPSIEWLFLGRVIAGITGASFTTASAYIADISDDKNRAQNFGMIGAAFGMGFILGPIIGGLLGSFGPRVPFIAAAALCFLNWLYGYFILPESLSKDHRRELDWKRANPIGSLMHLKKYPDVSYLLVAMVLVYLAAHAVQSNWSFYTIERFGWGEGMIGVSLGVVGLLVGIVQGGLTRVINPKLGNARSIYIGLSLYAIGMLLFGLATSGWMMLVFLVPYCLGGIAGPALQATITSEVDVREQGELQGALTSLMSATSIIGPPMMTNLFAWSIRPGSPIYLPGAPFFLGSLLLVISAVIAFISFKKHQKKVSS